MNHQIALVQLAKIDLSAMAFGMVKPSACMRRKTSEQFGRGQNYKIGRGETEPARERAQHQIDILERGRINDLAEPLNFAFGLKVNDDPCFTGAPVVQLSNELV